MKKILIAITAAVMLSSSGAWAITFVTGSELLTSCTEPSGSVRRAMCSGYMAGVAGGYTLRGAWENIPEDICMPDGVTIGQLVRVVTKHLEEHPEKLHFGAASLATNAYLEAFPCE